jgi:hypothetical protein
MDSFAFNILKIFLVSVTLYLVSSNLKLTVRKVKIRQSYMFNYNNLFSLLIFFILLVVMYIWQQNSNQKYELIVLLSFVIVGLLARVRRHE